MCTAVKSYRKPTGSSPYKGNTPPSHPTTQPPNHPARSYPLCKQGSKPDRGHFLSECSFLAEQYIAKARQIADIFDDPLNLGADLGRWISQWHWQHRITPKYPCLPQTDSPVTILGHNVFTPPSARNLWQWRHRKQDSSTPLLTPERHFLKRNKDFCRVHAICTLDAHSDNAQPPVSPSPRPPVHLASKKHSVNMGLDPDSLLSHDTRAKFTSVLDE